MITFFSGSRSTDLRYRIGLAVGYGVPFLISFLTGIVEATAPRCSSIKPRFIEGSCFFSSKSMSTIFIYISLKLSACGRISSVLAWKRAGCSSLHAIAGGQATTPARQNCNQMVLLLGFMTLVNELVTSFFIPKKIQLPNEYPSSIHKLSISNLTWSLLVYST